MHNWLEGILQHHARVKWGIGIIPTTCRADDLNKLGDDLLDTDNLPYQGSDIEMLDQEVEELFMESQPHEDLPTNLSRMHSTVSMLGNPDYSDEGTDESFNPSSDDGNSSSSSDCDSEADFQANKEDDKWKLRCIFDPVTLARIRSCLADSHSKLA
jgi:hypothetical protein